MRAWSLLFALIVAATPVVAGQNARDVWGRVDQPSAGEPEIHGNYNAGCIAGARLLPPEGTGYQAIRLNRNRFYGHPELIDFIQDFGQKVDAAGLGVALIGDMNQPRGGPVGGHVSHQVGLDADIWLRLDLPFLPRARRNALRYVVMTDSAGRRANPEVWGDKQAEMVRIAAEDPRVQRIFLNAALKYDLCQRDWDDRKWLAKVRPWGGHDGHMHVRLACPKGQPNCQDQGAVGGGDGCGAELMAKLPDPAAGRTRAIDIERPTRTRAIKPLPAACNALLDPGMPAQEVELPAFHEPGSTPPPPPVDLAARPEIPGPPAHLVTPRPPMAEPMTHTRIQLALEGRECSRVAAAMEGDPGHVHLIGHVPDARERFRLRETLLSIPGVAEVNDTDLLAMSPEFCRVFAAMEAGGLAPFDDLTGLGTAVHDEVLRFGDEEQIAFRLRAPAFNGHVYVDYFDREGNVLHILPNPVTPDRWRKADSPIRVGDGGDQGRRYYVAAPFGLELITAVASTHPLFPEVRSEVEKAEDYLPALTEALRRVGDLPDSRAAFTYDFVVTHP